MKVDAISTAIVDFSAGTTIYVLDDGIDIYHSDFGGRAKWGYSVYYATPNSGTGHGENLLTFIRCLNFYSVTKYLH